jgi:hypothetical protein
MLFGRAFQAVRLCGCGSGSPAERDVHLHTYRRNGEKSTRPRETVRRVPHDSLVKRKSAMDAWHTHKWIVRAGRIVSVNGCWKKEYLCKSCRRRFVEIVDSGERFAAYASLFDFEPLAPEVSDRWMREACPGARLPSDIADYMKRPLRVG